MQDSLPVVAAIGVVIACLVLAVPVIQWREQTERLTVLSDLAKYARPLRDSAAAAEGLRRQNIIDLLADRLVRGTLREQLARQLQLAARPEREALLAESRRKVIYGLVGLGMGTLMGLVSGGVMLPIYLFGMTGAGFFLPDLLVYNAATKRDEAIAQQLPEALDLLTLCVESGMSFQGALTQVVSNQKGAVAEEFARILSEMALGQSRAEALTALLARSRQIDLMRFIGALLQVDKMGVPVGPVLTEQANDMRSRRRERAREKAQQLPVKILPPVMLCFLPGVFVIVLGPAVVNIMRSFSGGL